MRRARQNQRRGKNREHQLAGVSAHRGSHSVVEQGFACAHERKIPDLFFITFDIARSKYGLCEDAQAVSCTAGQVSPQAQPHPYSRNCDARLTRRVDEKFQSNERQIGTIPKNLVVLLLALVIGVLVQPHLWFCRGVPSGRPRSGYSCRSAWSGIDSGSPAAPSGNEARHRRDRRQNPQRNQRRRHIRRRHPIQLRRHISTQHVGHRNPDRDADCHQNHRLSQDQSQSTDAFRAPNAIRTPISFGARCHREGHDAVQTERRERCCDAAKHNRQRRDQSLRIQNFVESACRAFSFGRPEETGSSFAMIERNASEKSAFR